MSSHLSETISDDKSLTWRRRVSKACATCRRDKIRCDGSRPCASCVKKGYTAEECTDGCEHCRRARVRCEDGKPCRRCQDMKLECSDSTRPPTRHPATPPAMPRIMQKGERAKLACSSCRRDNKKCDDQRPCSRCIARCEDCIHVGRAPKLVKLRCEGCRDTNKRCEDSRPCKYCTECSKECIVVPRKGKGSHGTRVKEACANCRRDKIRCNGERPCASCIKKGVECVERACQACSQDGIFECPHQKSLDSGLADKEGYSTFRSGTIELEPDTLQVIQSTYGQSNYSQERPQWSPYLPEHQSPSMMYRRTMPQPQYFFPPQVSSQFIHVPLSVTHTMQSGYSGTNLHDPHRHYRPSDYNNIS